MAAPTSYPSFVYAPNQPAQIVANVSQFNALPGGPTVWGTVPFAVTPNAPFDPGLNTTDIRLQQMLVEQRVTNQMLQFGLNIADDPVTQIRPDVLANDAGLAS